MHNGQTGNFQTTDPASSHCLRPCKFADIAATAIPAPAPPPPAKHVRQTRCGVLSLKHPSRQSDSHTSLSSQPTVWGRPFPWEHKLLVLPFSIISSSSHPNHSARVRSLSLFYSLSCFISPTTLSIAFCGRCRQPNFDLFRYVFVVVVVVPAFLSLAPSPNITPILSLKFFFVLLQRPIPHAATNELSFSFMQIASVFDRNLGTKQQPATAAGTTAPSTAVSVRPEQHHRPLIKKKKNSKPNRSARPSLDNTETIDIIFLRSVLVSPLNAVLRPVQQHNATFKCNPGKGASR